MAAPTAQTPYLLSGNFCGAGKDVNPNGVACGACYRIATDRGSAVVQVVNAAGSTFNCHTSAFAQITGGKTSGVIDVSYEPVPCDTGGMDPVGFMMAGSNQWYSKAIFSNLRFPVKAAVINQGNAP